MRTLLLSLLALCLAAPAFSQKNKPVPAVPAPKPGIEERLFNALEWRCVGPFRGGRSAAVTGVAGQPNLFYFGGTGGGVWRTADGGRSWENISDGFFGGSVGAVEVAPSDPNVIYAGGGEVMVRGNVSYGTGVWKSDDAGKTWTSMGLKNSRHIPRLRVHPDNPDVVYAAVLGDLFKSSPERGVYRSRDGGKNWERVLFVNEDTEIANFGEHLLRRTCEELFYSLKVRPRLLAGKQLPGIGINPVLEDVSVPQGHHIEKEMIELVHEPA